MPGFLCMLWGHAILSWMVFLLCLSLWHLMLLFLRVLGSPGTPLRGEGEDWLTIISFFSWSIPPDTVSPRPCISFSLCRITTDTLLSVISSSDSLASSMSFSNSLVDSRMVELELSDHDRSRRPLGSRSRKEIVFVYLKTNKGSFKLKRYWNVTLKRYTIWNVTDSNASQIQILEHKNCKSLYVNTLLPSEMFLKMLYTIESCCRLLTNKFWLPFI